MAAGSEPDRTWACSGVVLVQSVAVQWGLVLVPSRSLLRSATPRPLHRCVSLSRVLARRSRSIRCIRLCNWKLIIQAVMQSIIDKPPLSVSFKHLFEVNSSSVISVSKWRLFETSIQIFLPYFVISTWKASSNIHKYSIGYSLIYCIYVNNW